MTERLDPGAYIGHEPELEEETIPGGVKPGDERVAAHDAAPGVPGEPDAASSVDEAEVIAEEENDRPRGSPDGLGDRT